MSSTDELEWKVDGDMDFLGEWSQMVMAGHNALGAANEGVLLRI